MNYLLRRLVLGAAPGVEIGEQEFDQARCAQSGLIAAAGIEEKQFIVRENFIALEASVHDWVLRQMVHGDPPKDVLSDGFPLLNRGISNLLSSGRLYLDQVRADLKEILDEDSIALKEFDALHEHERASKSGFRVMEAMRNHVQHRSLPVRGLVSGRSVMEQSAAKKIKWTCEICADVQHIRTDHRFDPKICDELEARAATRNPNKTLVDLRPLIHEYLDGLAAIHNGVRQLIQPSVEQWESLVQELLSRGREAFSGEVAGLAVVRVNPDSQAIEESYFVFDGLIARRRACFERCQPVPSLLRSFFSAELVADNL